MPEPPSVSTIPEALVALGLPASAPERRPVLRGARGTLITIAELHEGRPPTWYGLWVEGATVRPLGGAPPPSLLSGESHLAGPTALLVDRLQAGFRAAVERLEALGSRLDDIEARPDPGPIAELAQQQRALAAVRKHVVRLAVLLVDLGGPLGTSFPGLGPALPQLQNEAAHLETLSAGLAQATRDLVGIRTAMESNRLAESANELGRVSNRIAALANTSNLRMLGVAYLALVLGLVSAVVLIPNTAATILGMPSAAWVPGLWVDVILVVLAVVPIAFVFSRGWVHRMLRGIGSYESRSAEGLADLPEVPAADVDRHGEGERLIRQAP